MADHAARFHLRRISHYNTEYDTLSPYRNRSACFAPALHIFQQHAGEMLMLIWGRFLFHFILKCQQISLRRNNAHY